jgi:Tfp pilus assembly protein PilF
MVQTVAANGPPRVSPPIGVQAGNQIGGHVFTTSRQPLANFQIELLDEVESVIRRTRTDSSGRYLFGGLAQGTYHVRVLTYGTNFVSQTARVSIVNVSVAGGGRVYEEQSFVLKTVEEEKTGVVSKSTQVVFTQEVPESARGHYESAVAKLDGNEAEAGVEELKKAIEVFPNYYLALERLGLEYLKQRQYRQVVEVLNRALKVNPKGHASLYAIGVALYHLKLPDEAVDSLTRAASLAPNFVNAHLWLGIVLFRTGKQNAAEAPLKRAYELGGNQVPDVHMFLAQIYSNTKRYKDAADELELFLKEVPNAQDAENIRAIISRLREKARL